VRLGLFVQLTTVDTIPGYRRRYRNR